jgi:pyruvate dehydrogenase E1 component
MTLAPEGGAHQSITTPSIGIEQPGCVSYEPAFAIDVEWTRGYPTIARPDRALPRTPAGPRGTARADCRTGGGGTGQLRQSAAVGDQARLVLQEQVELLPLIRTIRTG